MQPNPHLPSAVGRVMRGYAPVAILGLLLAIMAATVPSTYRDAEVSAANPGTSDPAVGGGQGGGGSPLTTTDSGGTGGGGADAGGAATGSGSSGGGAGGDGDGGDDGGDGGAGAPGAGQRPCPDRDEQIPGDPYSPPCFTFSGDNGGATAKGVTPEEIIVSARILDEKGFQQTLATLAGAEILDEPEDVKRTISALAQYFNQRMQFYGRKLAIEFYDGKGSNLNELQGAGQAEADAITVAEEIGALAELNATSAPFADALARKQVIAFGTPYLSRSWHVDRRPYNWSVATDCSIIVESVGEFANQTLANKPAVFAGPGLKDKPRKFAAFSPENPWYIDCIDQGIKVAEDAGNTIDERVTYRLDIDSMSNQAASIITKLKSEGITTVLCGCDPIMPIFLTTKAAEQGYNPEWVVAGTAFSDIDIVGQLYEQDQWSRAFGVSFLSSFRPIESGIGHSAYKSVRDDEPAFAVEVIYSQMYMLALGIHMAGPNLTPGTYVSVFIGAGTVPGARDGPPAGGPPGDGEVALRATGICRSFGGVHAVDDVDLDVGAGEIVGVVGANGAGKTTLLDLLSGAVAVDQGRIELDGTDVTDVTDLSAHRRARLGLARTFQDARLFPSLTVAENLSVALDRSAPSRDPVAAALRLAPSILTEIVLADDADELIDALGLQAFRDKRVSQLSTGSRRVVELASLVAQDAEVLLLDEPSAGIAQREAEALGPVLRRFRDTTGAAMVIVEHDVPLLRATCDRLVAMHLGAVIAEGRPADVLAAPEVVAAYLGSSVTAVERSGSAEGAGTGRRRARRRPLTRPADQASTH